IRFCDVCQNDSVTRGLFEGLQIQIISAQIERRYLIGEADDLSPGYYRLVEGIERRNVYFSIRQDIRSSGENIFPTWVRANQREQAGIEIDLGIYAKPEYGSVRVGACSQYVFVNEGFKIAIGLWRVFGQFWKTWIEKRFTVGQPLARASTRSVNSFFEVFSSRGFDN